MVSCMRMCNGALHEGSEMMSCSRSFTRPTNCFPSIGHASQYKETTSAPHNCGGAGMELESDVYFWHHTSSRRKLEESSESKSGICSPHMRHLHSREKKQVHALRDLSSRLPDCQGPSLHCKKNRIATGLTCFCLCRNTC